MFRKLIFILIMSALLVSCYSDTSDSILLDQTSVSPLSWGNIELGKSHKQEAIDSLSKNDLVDKDSIVDAGEWSIFDSRVIFDLRHHMVVHLVMHNFISIGICTNDHAMGPIY